MELIVEIRRLCWQFEESQKRFWMQDWCQWKSYQNWKGPLYWEGRQNKSGMSYCQMGRYYSTTSSGPLFSIIKFFQRYQTGSTCWSRTCSFCGTRTNSSSSLFNCWQFTISRLFFADSSTFWSGWEIPGYSEASSRTLLSFCLHYYLHCCMGSSVKKHIRWFIQCPHWQTEQIWFTHQTPLWYKWPQNLRMPRNRSKLLWCEFLFRLLLEHVLQRMQVHQIQIRQEVQT